MHRLSLISIYSLIAGHGEHAHKPPSSSLSIFFWLLSQSWAFILIFITLVVLWYKRLLPSCLHHKTGISICNTAEKSTHVSQGGK